MTAGCSPFGNESFIESLKKELPSVFLNIPSIVKSTPTGGQIVSNAAGYRMNVGIGPMTARTRSCNFERCIEIGISK